jgi:transcriptional regulator with XRE-family HTH domain
MEGSELRQRLDRLRQLRQLRNVPYTELAGLLGLSPSGLHKQMNGQARVSRQTEMLLERLEQTVEVWKDTRWRRAKPDDEAP